MQAFSVYRRVQPIVWICIAAVLVRLTLAAVAYWNSGGWTGCHSPDTDSYIATARQIWLTGNFAKDSGEPELFRTPGYPLLLIPGTAAGAVEPVTIALQLALSVATIYLVYRTALLLFPARPSVATVTAALLAVEPMSVVYSCMILSETLFTFLIAAFGHAAVRYFDKQRFAALAGASLLLSASVYVRPAAYLLLPALLAGATLYAIVGSTDRRRVFGHVALASLLCIAAIGPWHLRNMMTTGYRGFSSTSEVNMYFFTGASVLAQKSGKSLEQMQHELDYHNLRAIVEKHPELRSGGAAALYGFMQEGAARALRENKLAYAKIHLRGLGILLANPGSSDFLRLINCYPDSASFRGGIVETGLLGSIQRVARESPTIFAISVIMGLINVSYLSLAGLGLIKHGLRLTWPLSLLLLTALYFFLIAGGPMCLARYRHPMMPIVCTLGAFFVCTMQSRRQARVPLADSREITGAMGQAA